MPRRLQQLTPYHRQAESPAKSAVNSRGEVRGQRWTEFGSGFRSPPSARPAWDRRALVGSVAEQTLGAPGPGGVRQSRLRSVRQPTSRHARAPRQHPLPDLPVLPAANSLPCDSCDSWALPLSVCPYRSSGPCCEEPPGLWPQASARRSLSQVFTKPSSSGGKKVPSTSAS